MGTCEFILPFFRLNSLATALLFAITFQNLPVNKSWRVSPTIEQARCDELIPGVCAPYFSIIGAMKCGTNAVSEYLLQQPHIVLNPYREFHYFSDGFFKGEYYTGAFYEDKWSLDVNPEILNKYANSFEKTDWQNNFTFDKSPGYMQPGNIIPQRMKKLIPNIRVVAVVCDPVKRLFSHFHHLRRHGLVYPNPNSTFSEHADWALEDPAGRLHSGLYFESLLGFVEVLGKDHVYVLDSTRLSADPVNTLTELLNFLQIPVNADAWKRDEFKPVYTNPDKVGLKIAEEDKHKLVEAFQESVVQLQKKMQVGHSWENFQKH